MNSFEENARVRAAATLDMALARAFESYRGFILSHHSTGDIKEFTAHHAACRSVLGHINLLLRLAQWVDGGNKKNLGKKDLDVLESILDDAEQELLVYINKGQELKE